MLWLSEPEPLLLMHLSVTLFKKPSHKSQYNIFTSRLPIVKLTYWWVHVKNSPISTEIWLRNSWHTTFQRDFQSKIGHLFLMNSWMNSFRIIGLQNRNVYGKMEIWMFQNKFCVFSVWIAQSSNYKKNIRNCYRKTILPVITRPRFRIAMKW